MSFRKTIFWLHLVAGVVAGVVIAIMSFTGVALAYEKQLIAWAERDARRVNLPSWDPPRLTVDQLLAKFREVHPDAKPATMVLSADPEEAVLFGFGRTNTIYGNPYTGEIIKPASVKMGRFMQLMIEWHRYLGASGESRNTGKAITGACNAAFLVLAVTGLYLWWPRQFSKKLLAAVALMNFKLRGKARDFNWHNAIGLWSAPVLIVLTATAMPISYRWAGDLIYKITGSEPPPAGGPAGAAPAVEVTKPAPDARPLPMSALVARAQEAVPNWGLITLRPGGGGGGRGGGPGGSRPEVRADAGPGSTNAVSLAQAPAGAQPAGVAVGEPNGRREGGRGDAQPVSLTVKERDPWPLFSTIQLTLNPYTGEVLRRETYQDQNAGRKVRSWTRFLHTGEALGLIGQGVAGLASLGALFLVWTGFALAWRRFFFKRQPDPAPTA